MGYKKAQEFLPDEIIELIQKYVDGTNIYIPRKQDNRLEWGSKTSYKQDLQQRDQLIYSDYLSGMTICSLAEKYYLSEKSIRRIIRKEKSQV